MLISQNISISVIIPAYNRAKTIRYCLDSVLVQTQTPLEIIVVDDCSTDETVAIVRSYSDSRIRCVVLQKNSGAQAARNRGIREARGEWIAFQDSDDEWLPEKLERQTAALAKINFDPMTVVHSDGLLHTNLSGKTSSWNLPLVHGEKVYTILLESAGPAFPAILTSKKALVIIGLLDEGVPSFQEWDASICLARECRFIHIQEPLFIYHLHDGETISKDRTRELDGYHYIVNKYWDDILLLCGINALNRHLIAIALMAMRCGYFQKAEEILAKALGKSAKISFLKKQAQSRLYPATFVRLNNLLQLAKTTYRRVVTY